MPVYAKTGSYLATKRECRYTGCVCLSRSSTGKENEGSVTQNEGAVIL